MYIDYYISWTVGNETILAGIMMHDATEDIEDRALFPPNNPRILSLFHVLIPGLSDTQCMI